MLDRASLVRESLRVWRPAWSRTIAMCTAVALLGFAGKVVLSSLNRFPAQLEARVRRKRGCERSAGQELRWTLARTRGSRGAAAWFSRLPWDCCQRMALCFAVPKGCCWLRQQVELRCPVQLTEATEAAEPQTDFIRPKAC